MARATTEKESASYAMTDHEDIRQWAEARGGVPAHVVRTGYGDDVGMIRIDFPDYGDATSLEQISWEQWFAKFEEKGLALLVERQPAGGDKSRFNKLINRQHGKQG
ncbi:MAG: hypothetical protein AB7N91_31300 [Candidatus Tectimicrobiota bacterium]